MRRYARTLIFIAILVIVAVAILGFKEISLGGFERGGDTLLGLSLGLDLQGGSHLVYRAVDTETREPITPAEDEMEALKRSIERRVNSSGLGEPIIQLLGDDRLLVQLPGVRDTDRAKGLIGETAQLVFKRRSSNVPRDLDEITPQDIVNVRFGPLSDVDPTLLAAPTATFTDSDVSTSSEAQVGENGTSTVAGSGVSGDLSDEGNTPTLYVEFTEAATPIFLGVVARLQQTLLGLSTQNVSAQIPSRLELNIQGNQPLRFEVTALSIQQVATTSEFAFRLPASETSGDFDDLGEARALLGPNATIKFVEIQGIADEDIGLTGDDLTRAYANQQSAGGLPVVNIVFNERGTRIFGQLTRDILAHEIETGERDAIAIFLDDEELIAPVVNSEITSGTAVIQGADFTLERVRNLALLLEAGALPLTIELIQERSVDASLGSDSLSKSVVAGMVGLGLVLVFMSLYYRIPGVVAAVALVIYLAMLLAVFKILPVTLTLSGVAAVILSVGMAVDANILIFERMKEELRAGRTLLSSINNGFNRAWPAIRDGNVSTLITCGILFWFSDQLGATVVQGFAATLAIGVTLSMFSAITISRTFLRVVAMTFLGRRLGVFVPAGGADLPQQQQAAAQAAPRR